MKTAKPCEISILIPTLGREALLDACLRSLFAASQEDINVEAILLLNGNYHSAIGEKWKASASRTFSVTVHKCVTLGKNAALNEGIAISHAPLIACLDDDVTVSKSWLTEIWAGYNRWNAAAFGGAVEAVCPTTKHEIEPEVLSYVKRFAHGDFCPEWPEGPMPPGKESVLGNNMLFSRSQLASVPLFEEGDGPKGEFGYRMGGSAATIHRMVQEGRSVVYLPKAIVKHHLRPQQMEYDWILRRAFSWGRSVGHFGTRWRSIDGRSPGGKLRLQWFARAFRASAYRLKHTKYPRRWAEIDREVIAGVLFERRQSIR